MWVVDNRRGWRRERNGVLTFTSSCRPTSPTGPTTARRRTNGVRPTTQASPSAPMWLCTRSYTSARPPGPPRCRTGRPLRTSMSSVCVACLSAPCPPPVLLVGFYLEYPQTMCVCVGCGYQPFLFLSRVPVYRYLSSLERAPAGHQLQWNYNTN